MTVGLAVLVIGLIVALTVAPTIGIVLLIVGIVLVALGR